MKKLLSILMRFFKNKGPSFRKGRTLEKKVRLIYVLFVILVLLPLFYLVNKYKPSAQAAWYDDNYLYRQKITIGNTGAADSNKKIKLDINTADLVDPDTANFNTTDQTFTAGGAKRNGRDQLVL